jgi:hypothetical protein
MRYADRRRLTRSPPAVGLGVFGTLSPVIEPACFKRPR